MYEHVTAKKFTTNNRKQIRSSLNVGCVYCLEIFEPKNITQWNGDTAICAYCNCDSLIADKSGYNISKHFLRLMHDYWFQPVDELTSHQLSEQRTIDFLNECHLGVRGFWIDTKELDPYTDYRIFERSREIFRTLYPKELLIKLSQILHDSEVRLISQNISVGGEPISQESLQIRIHYTDHQYRE